MLTECVRRRGDRKTKGDSGSGQARARQGVFALQGFLMARPWHLEWCTRGSAVTTACTLAILFSIRCMFQPVYAKSYILWNIRAAVRSYLRTVMWLTQGVFLFPSLMHEIQSLWLHAFLGEDVGGLWLENALPDGRHPNGAAVAQPKDVLNMSTVKQVNNIRGMFDRRGVGGN